MSEQWLVFTHPLHSTVMRVLPDGTRDLVATFGQVVGRNPMDDANAFITAVTVSDLYMPYMPRAAKLIRRVLRWAAGMALCRRGKLIISPIRYHGKVWERRYRFWTAVAQFCSSLLEPEAYL